MNKLKEIIPALRAENQEFRMIAEKQMVKRYMFYNNVITIATSLAEMFIEEQRKISNSEKYWFEGGYYMSMDISGEFPDLYSHYIDLVVEVEAQNAFEE